MLCSTRQVGIRASSLSFRKVCTAAQSNDSRDTCLRNSPASIDIVGVPIDLGGNRRGVDCGPSALRFAGINAELQNVAGGTKVRDLGNIEVKQPEELGDGATRTDAITEVCRKLKESVKTSALSGHFPLILGGDHSLAAGSMAGVQAARRQLGLPPAGLLWFDAHADINTPETSPSGNLHGMPLAALLGLKVPGLKDVVGEDGLFDPARVAVVGARSLDAEERKVLASLGVHVFTMREIDEQQMASVMKAALDVVAPYKGAFCLSLDVDGLDPEVAPGVGTPVNGGISYREGHLAMEMIADHGGLCAMDIVEVNPIVDRKNVTAINAVEMAASALGKTII